MLTELRLSELASEISKLIAPCTKVTKTAKAESQMMTLARGSTLRREYEVRKAVPNRTKPIIAISYLRVWFLLILVRAIVEDMTGGVKK